MKNTILTLKFIFTILILTALIAFSREVSSAVKQSVNMCLSVIVPSLFCFMTLSNFLVTSDLADIISKPVRGIFSRLFKIKKDNVKILILSLIGGYPVGASLIVGELNKEALTKLEAERLLCFCVNSGPAFVFTAVSGVYFDSLIPGAVIFASHFTACLIIANLTYLKYKDNINFNEKIFNCKKMHYSEKIIDAVSYSSKTLFGLCALIVIFSVVIEIAKRTGFINVIISFMSVVIDRQTASGLLYGFLEITNGCLYLQSISGINKLLTAAFITAFGGLCVHLQIFNLIKKSGIRFLPFVVTRYIYSCISVVSCYAYSKIFNVTVESSITTSLSVSHNDNYIASVFVIFLCILLLYNIEKFDIILIKKLKRTKIYEKIKIFRSKYRAGM